MTLPAASSNSNARTLAKVNADTATLSSSSTSNGSSCDSSWNLYTLDEDRRTIICNNRNKPLVNELHRLCDISPKKNCTGKQPMPPPPTDDYDRVPLGPPIPVPKKMTGLSNRSSSSAVGASALAY